MCGEDMLEIYIKNKVLKWTTLYDLWGVWHSASSMCFPSHCIAGYLECYLSVTTNNTQLLVVGEEVSLFVSLVYS